jgi:transcriptional regulator with XRE-family HTH domain
MIEPASPPRHHLRAWRKHRGLTQAALAQAMGFARSYVTKVERGDRRYDEVFMDRAAAALGCTAADLISHPPVEWAEALSIWAALSPNEQTRALAVVKAMFAPD